MCIFLISFLLQVVDFFSDPQRLWELLWFRWSEQTCRRGAFNQFHLISKVCHLGCLWPWKERAMRQCRLLTGCGNGEGLRASLWGCIDFNFFSHLLWTFPSSFIKFNNTRSRMKEAKNLPWVYSVVGKRDQSFYSWRNHVFFHHLS